MKRIARGPDAEAAEPFQLAVWLAGGRSPRQDAAADWPELAARWATLQAALPGLVRSALERLLDEELALRPEHIAATVRGLLERTSSGGGLLVLRIHPDDVEHLREVASLDAVRVVPDPAIRAGGCVLGLDGAELDARLETRLSRIVSAFASR